MLAGVAWLLAEGGVFYTPKGPFSSKHFTWLELLAKVSQNPTLGHGLDTFGSVFLCPKVSQNLELN